MRMYIKPEIEIQEMISNQIMAGSVTVNEDKAPEGSKGLAKGDGFGSWGEDE